MSLFSQIDIETHNVCNRKCGYCPVVLDKRGPDQYMPDEMFAEIIKQLSEMRFSGRINLNLYNEPLLDERLDRFAIKIKRELPAAKLHLYSNGDYLDDNRINKLLSVGVWSIKITDHNPVPNKRLIDMMKRIGGKYGGRVTMHRFDSKSPLHNRGGSLDHHWTRRKSHVCWPAQSAHAYVDFKGNMLSCCDDAFSQTSFGNLAEKTIAEIWNSEQYQKFRRGLLEDRYYFEICANCNVNAGKKVTLEKFQ